MLGFCLQVGGFLKLKYHCQFEQRDRGNQLEKHGLVILKGKSMGHLEDTRNYWGDSKRLLFQGFLKFYH